MKRIAFYVSVGVTMGSGIAAALVACGGSTDDSQAIVSPDRDSGGGSTSSGGASSGSSSGGSTSSSGGTNDGGTNEGGTNEGGASGGTPNAIACGSATCNATTQKCCTTFEQGTGAVATCIATADNCQGAEIACDDKTDCPGGQICCGGGGAGSFGATCQTNCNGIQVCKAANECTDGGACATYTCVGQQVSLCRKPQFGCQ